MENQRRKDRDVVNLPVIVMTNNFSNGIINQDQKSEEGCESSAITRTFKMTGTANTILQVTYTVHGKSYLMKIIFLIIFLCKF